jgi:tRNA (guanine-N7-)-methyltransferase
MARISIRSIRYRRPAVPTWDTELERSIVIDNLQTAALLDYSALFNRQAAFHVEIGFGKGRFLLAAAQRFPENNWFGIEYAPPCVSLVAERAARNELQNIRIVRGVAEEIVSRSFPDNLVSAYHIYFPDPWHKKRHHKRRLIQPPFAAELHRTLAVDGSVHVATDNEGYFREIVAALSGAGMVQGTVAEEYSGEEFRTNFEMRYIKQEQPVYRTVFSKVTA